jgi:hypothetical protein
LSLNEFPAEFFAPRHKHNFDQIRVCLSGTFTFGKGQSLNPGQLAFFPEGAEYGPEKQEGDAHVLVLQLAGASGSGYISLDKLQWARKELAKVGEFKNGRYKDAGTGRALDAHEALSEFVTGKEMRYPEPRYPDPIVISPAAFDWRPSSQAGVRSKQLAVLTEDRLSLALIEIDRGVHYSHRSIGESVMFVMTGAGQVESNPYAEYDAFELLSGERTEIAPSVLTCMLEVQLPSVLVESTS